MRKRILRFAAVLALILSSFAYTQTADASCTYEQYGITYLVLEPSEGYCTVYTFDSETGESTGGSSSGPCTPGSGSC